jgi:hypothetical protein
MPRVAVVSPPPTVLPEMPKEDARKLGRAWTQHALGALPGVSVAEAVRASQREGMAILPLLRAGDYRGASLAWARSTTAALGAIPEVRGLSVLTGASAAMTVAKDPVTGLAPLPGAPSPASLLNPGGEPLGPAAERAAASLDALSSAKAWGGSK